jgi:hypothetical protein
MTDTKRTARSKQPKAEDYTHSVWTGKKYDRPQTQAELIAESMAILRRHPTMSKCLIGSKRA